MFRRPAPLPEEDRLDLAGQVCAYRIRVSARRRTLALELRADGSLTVAVPRGLGLATVREFVSSRQRWIAAKRALLAEHRPARVVLEHGTRLPFLGSELVLQLQPGITARAGCRREQDALVMAPLPEEKIRPAIEGWYRRSAAEHVQARVAHFAPRVGRAPRSISIRAQRSRWGSCSARGALSFNWRLLQADPGILDYVVVHELCHLLVPDHSPRFWAEVARVLPDHAERRAALRRFGRALVF